MNESVDWLLGWRDCENGVAHISGMSSDYDDGYNYCYQKEQIDGAER